MPKGIYEVYVWKAGFDVAGITVEITGDRAVELEALAQPEADPDARWQM